MATNIKLIKETAKKYGLTLKGALSIESAAKLLENHFEHLEGVELADCFVCGKASPESVEYCPFCGEKLGEPQHKTETTVNRKERVMEEETENTTKETAETEETEETAEEADEPVAPVAPPAPTTRKIMKPGKKGKKIAKKGKKGKIAETTSRKTGKKGRPKKNDAEKKEETVALVATPEQKEELAKHVRAINDYKADIARNGWKIGHELIAISVQGLWKGLGYNSFNEYLKKDLDFSSSLARKYMVIANTYDVEQYKVLGVKKGELIAAAPPKHQKKLMTMATDEGASFTELRAKLNSLTGKGKTSKVQAEKSVTLLGRVKEGDIVVSWTTESGIPVVDPSAKDKIARIQVTDTVFLTIREVENRLALILKFEKPGDESTSSDEPVDDRQTTIPGTEN